MMTVEALLGRTCRSRLGALEGETAGGTAGVSGTAAAEMGRGRINGMEGPFFSFFLGGGKGGRGGGKEEEGGIFGAP